MQLDKRVLLLEVISLFDQLHARVATNDAQQPLAGFDKSAHTTLFACSLDPTLTQLCYYLFLLLSRSLIRSRHPAASDLLTVESTTLTCLQLAITQDSFLSEVLLYIVQTHEIKLSPFSLALLLTMAHIRRHQEATLIALTRYINEQLTAATKKYEWSQLSELIDNVAGVLHDTDVEQLLVRTAQQSLRMDAIRPYVTALAMRLIDTDCKKDNTDVARLDKSQYQHTPMKALLVLFHCAAVC